MVSSVKSPALVFVLWHPTQYRLTTAGTGEPAWVEGGKEDGCCGSPTPIELPIRNKAATAKEIRTGERFKSVPSKRTIQQYKTSLSVISGGNRPFSWKSRGSGGQPDRFEGTASSLHLMLHCPLDTPRRLMHKVNMHAL